eukprot:TRINITY_DN29261_c0_g1_i1.p1 TRINITY_DN29261_c0_g1~~TRINITY_DN29261_c0_g1_i1.p1  ORF type:complete len:1287 (-),score=185.15 TRINITY_DN29261_c0_g1_i1:256-4116(-)
MQRKPGDAPFNAFIVDAVRTAGGKRGGRLSGWHPADIGGAVCDALLERTGIDGANVDDVAWGCCTQDGSQAENLGRNMVLSSKRLPDSVPAFTIDRQCGSAQQALHLAAQAVMSGTQDCVIAGGVEMMSVVPMDSNVGPDWHRGPHTGQAIVEKYGERIRDAYAHYEVDPVKFDQFAAAEMVAKKFNITRREVDEFAARSHALANAASKAGRFSEIVPIRCRSRPGISKGEAPDELHTTDEGIRPSTNVDALAKLKPIVKNGILSAACASQICDGASAMLICNERALKKMGLRPRARVVSLALSGVDPVVMLDGPIPATQTALTKAGLTMNDIDLIEVNEAFSSIPLAVAKAFLGGDLTKLNVNGGAIARGHPMGATGGMLMANLIGELERRSGRYGLLTMCESGGTANATIVERISGPTMAPTITPSALSSQAEATPVRMNMVGKDGRCFQTLGRALHTVAAWRGDALGFSTEGPGVEPHHMTFQEIDAKSNKLARSYVFFGVSRNDLVTISLPSGPEFIIVTFATWKLGATPNNVSATLTFKERDDIIRLAQPRIVVGVPSKKDPAMQLHDGFKCVKEGFDPGPYLSSTMLPDRYANSWLVATSGGSTGRPKLIVLNEPSFVTMKDIGDGRLAMEDGFSVTGGGRVCGTDLIPSPLSHNAPFHCAIQGILSASHQVLLTKFDAEKFLQLVQQYRITFCYLVPTTMKRVWDLAPEVRNSYDVSSLEACFHMAAPCPPWLKEAWCSWLGPEKIWECYGPTEATALTVIRGDEWVRRPKIDGLNLVGKPLYGELKILDPETREELSPGTMGEVWMRHHERRITYYYRGAETVSLDNGWETVGDIGMLDEDGYCHLGDRKKDMVLIAGQNIYPAEVEAALEEIPAIKSAVVVGVPDDDLGNVLHAVVYTGGEEISPADISALLKDRLNRNKIPRGYSFAEAHVRGEDGKARRSEVAKWVLENVYSNKKPSSSNSAISPNCTSAAAGLVPINFAGRVAIVTGAGNGIGREYALLLGKRGAKVVVNDLGTGLGGEGTSTSSAEKVAAEIRQAGGEAVADCHSVTDGQSIVKTALDAYGRVDIIINNAGILRDVSFRKMTDDQWDKVYQVHLKGAFSVTHAAWPHMEKNQFGRIIFITSGTGLYGSFGQANYAAMKSAVLGLTFTLALEGKKRNIRANAVAPLAASRMMETVRSKEELAKLPMQTIPNLIAYLCHDSCDCTGGIFELGGYWISRLGWRRSRGVRFPAGFTPEDVAARFQELSSFDEGAEYPEDCDSSEIHSMQPPTERSKL